MFRPGEKTSERNALFAIFCGRPGRPSLQTVIMFTDDTPADSLYCGVSKVAGPS